MVVPWPVLQKPQSAYVRPTSSGIRRKHGGIFPVRFRGEADAKTIMPHVKFEIKVSKRRYIAAGMQGSRDIPINQGTLEFIIRDREQRATKG